MVSITDQNAVRNVLEYVVCFGIYPYLLPGVDAVLKVRMEHAAHVAKAVEAWQGFRNRQLYDSCSFITKFLQNSIIGPPLTTKFLVDVLAALIQVIYAPASSIQGDKLFKSSQIKELETSCILLPNDVPRCHQEVDCESINKMSTSLLNQILERTYQPLLVQQLLMLQGPCSSASSKAGATLARPAWFVKACGQLLSKRLMARNGIISVISGIMDATSGK